ncbi:GNAT family N-acetyltransferase [Streptomyces sp. PRKS01-29]|nr:GNAT family N-acetyltransferase [Streptomyces sabulosicollis]MBI0293958.1 GNAT family N-acetyltransferase [Streptomyces sabulosicollis]
MQGGCRPPRWRLVALARIELHPDYQGRGIGSRLIRTLLHQERERRQGLTLDVLVVNHRA